jgi:hypothetical protein
VAVVVGRPAEVGLGGLLLRLRLLLLLLGEEVVVAAEAGAGELLLVLLPHLADLGEIHGVVRQRAVLHVPVPERRHRHPPVPAARRRRAMPPLDVLHGGLLDNDDLSHAASQNATDLSRLSLEYLLPPGWQAAKLSSAQLVLEVVAKNVWRLERRKR